MVTTPVQHLLSDFQGSSRFTGCLGGVSVSNKAASEISLFAGALRKFCIIAFPLPLLPGLVMLLNISSAKDVNVYVNIYIFFSKQFFVVVVSSICFSASIVSEGRAVKSVNLLVHTESRKSNEMCTFMFLPWM